MSFAEDFRAKRASNNGSGPGGWGHLLNGLGALVFMWVAALYLLLGAGWWPMLIGGFIVSFVVDNAV